MKRLPPRVEVEWLDILQCAEWKTRKDVEETQPAQCRSVGYLLKMDAARLVLAHTLSDDESDHTTIPLGCVKAIHCLKRGGAYALKRKEPHGRT